MTIIPMHRSRPLPYPYDDGSLWSEGQLLARWIRLAETLNLKYVHFYSGVYSQYGVTDLILVGPGGIWWVELKVIGGTLAPNQQCWREKLEEAGANYAIHTPREWCSGDSQRLLHSIASDADVIELATRAA